MTRPKHQPRNRGHKSRRSPRHGTAPATPSARRYERAGFADLGSAGRGGSPTKKSCASNAAKPASNQSWRIALRAGPLLDSRFCHLVEPHERRATLSSQPMADARFWRLVRLLYRCGERAVGELIREVIEARALPAEIEARLECSRSSIPTCCAPSAPIVCRQLRFGKSRKGKDPAPALTGDAGPRYPSFQGSERG